jgi:transposase InsO family protein
LSISFALAKFKHILTGNKFKLFTDHKALVNLFEMRNELFTNTMCTWLEQILNFDFELVHLPGIENFLPDRLSRLYENTVKSRREELKEEAKDFHYMRKINYKDLPEDEQDDFLEELHLETGHGGINLMVNTCHYDREIHFEGLTKKCGSIVRNCKVCSKFNLVQRNYHPYKPIGALRPFDHVCIDMAGPFHSTHNGNNYIFVMVDVATKFVVLRPLANASSLEAAKALLDIGTNFGFPRVVMSDNGSNFVGDIFKEVLKTTGIDPRLISKYHPRANGLVEKMVGTMTALLRKLVPETNIERWDDYLSATQFHINNRNSVLGRLKPFELMFRRKSNRLNDFIHETLDIELLDTEDQAIIDTLLANWLDMFKNIYPGVFKKLKEQNQVRKQVFETNHPIKEFVVGDKVMWRVKTQMTSSHKPGKFEERYNGPGIIYEKKSSTYSICDPDNIDSILAEGVIPSAIKLVDTPSEILEKTLVDDLGNEGGKLTYYLAVYGKETHWVETNLIPPELIVDFEESSDADASVIPEIMDSHAEEPSVIIPSKKAKLKHVTEEGEVDNSTSKDENPSQVRKTTVVKSRHKKKIKKRSLSHFYENLEKNPEFQGVKRNPKTNSFYDIFNLE